MHDCSRKSCTVAESLPFDGKAKSMPCEVTSTFITTLARIRHWRGTRQLHERSKRRRRAGSSQSLKSAGSIIVTDEAHNFGDPISYIDKGFGTVSGNYVKILGPNWRIQYYAHMKKSNVWLLQFVRKGEKIGEVGNTGNAMGKPHHLHFSVTTILPISGKLMTRFKDGKSRFI